MGIKFKWWVKNLLLKNWNGRLKLRKPLLMEFYKLLQWTKIKLYIKEIKKNEIKF